MSTIRASQDIKDKLTTLWLKISGVEIDQEHFSFKGALKNKVPSYEKQLDDILNAMEDLLNGRDIDEQSLFADLKKFVKDHEKPGELQDSNPPDHKPA